MLINSNPATIMTDKDIADRVYIEPLTVEVVQKLIRKERPDSVLPTLGGQAALNIAMELEESGFLKQENVRLIGTTAQTIKRAEDRLEFKETMEKSTSRLLQVLSWNMWMMRLHLPTKSVIRLLSARHIPLAEAVVVSHITKKNCTISAPMVFV